MLNNLAFEKRNSGDDDLQSEGCTLCVLKHVRGNKFEINQNTIVKGNVADVGNGGKNLFSGKPQDFWPVAGKVDKEKNLFNAKIEEVLVDAKNHDFRPVKGKEADNKKIGPYKYSKGGRMDYYWIPGAQSEKAQFPVPKDCTKTPEGCKDSDTVIAERRDALMWLNAVDFKSRVGFKKAKECEMHNVYFGISKDDLIKRGTVENRGNIFYLSDSVPAVSPLNRGTEYFWRVDADCNGRIIEGDVWTFTTA